VSIHIVVSFKEKSGVSSVHQQNPTARRGAKHGKLTVSRGGDEV